MALRFVDHAGFQRTCLIAAAGGALGACYASWMAPAAGMIPWAAAGATFALAAAVRWQGEIPPAPCIAAAAALAVAAACAAPSLVSLREIAATILPASGASALAGAVLGLWLGGATAPLHVRAVDLVERRLAELRSQLEPEALRLAERAMSARVLLLRTAPAGVRPGLRRVADRLALAALDLAREGTEASRAELLDRVVQLERACSALG